MPQFPPFEERTPNSFHTTLQFGSAKEMLLAMCLHIEEERSRTPDTRLVVIPWDDPKRRVIAYAVVWEKVRDRDSETIEECYHFETSVYEWRHANNVGLLGPLSATFPTATDRALISTALQNGSFRTGLGAHLFPPETKTPEPRSVWDILNED